MRYLPRSVLDRSHLTRRLLGKPELAIERFIVMAALRHRDMSPSVHFAEAGAAGPVDAIPVKGAGRFVHEAVVWHQGILYQTEDQSFDSAFYRYVPRQTRGADRLLATTTGELRPSSSAMSMAPIPTAGPSESPFRWSGSRSRSRIR